MNASVFADAAKDAELTLLDPRAVEKFPIPTEQKYTRQQLDEMLKRAVEVHQTGNTQRAMQLYREILIHDRGNKQALYFATIALSQQNQPEEQVLALMKHAVAAVPNVPEAHYNLGILLHRMGREDDARERFLRAIALMPALTEAKTSLGGAYLNLGERERGIEWLTASAKSISQVPDSVYSRAFARLALGDLYNGWVDYDVRWKTASFLVENRRSFGKATHWNGKPIPGKNLYIHTEQGAGDVIMFSRFIEQVAERSKAAKIVLEVGDNLVDHLSQINGVDFVIASNSPTPEDALPIHHYLPMMGMMRKVGFFDYAKVPHRDGWLGVLPNFQVHLDSTERPKIGIAWAGSKAHKNDRYRSIAWSQFRDELLVPIREKLPHGLFYSFQVGERARDIDEGGQSLGVVDSTSELKTFAHTAHALKQMDLILAVDTATVHAAASLVDGPQVHMLLPAAPDWRWLLEGRETPWYSRVQLFRQTIASDWSTPIAQLRDATLDFVATTKQTV